MDKICGDNILAGLTVVGINRFKALMGNRNAITE